MGAERQRKEKSQVSDAACEPHEWLFVQMNKYRIEHKCEWGGEGAAQIMFLLFTGKFVYIIVEFTHADPFISIVDLPAFLYLVKWTHFIIFYPSSCLQNG